MGLKLVMTGLGQSPLIVTILLVHTLLSLHILLSHQLQSNPVLIFLAKHEEQPLASVGQLYKTTVYETEYSAVNFIQ